MASRKNKHILPSGSYRKKVYDRTITEIDENGNAKEVKKYISITASTPLELNLLVAEFKQKKQRFLISDFTFREAIDDYINKHDAVLGKNSVAEYRKLQNNAFKNLMDVKVKSINNNFLQNAINEEAKRPVARRKDGQSISVKTLLTEWGLISTMIRKYHPAFIIEVDLPKLQPKIKEVLEPDVIFNIIRGTEIELPCLLAMWLSFSESEIRGLKKSDVYNGHLSVKRTIVDVNGTAHIKNSGKVATRIRKHKIPDYIMGLISSIPEENEFLVTLTGREMYKKFTSLLKKNNLPHMSFHDLRHVNASVMAQLNINDKYAMERGGWSTDSTMKRVYTHTFSKERIEVDNKIDNFFIEKLNIDSNGIGTVLELLEAMNSEARKLCLLEHNSKIISVKEEFYGSLVAEQYNICDKVHFDMPTLRPILKI